MGSTEPSAGVERAVVIERGAVVGVPALDEDARHARVYVPAPPDAPGEPRRHVARPGQSSVVSSDATTNRVPFQVSTRSLMALGQQWGSSGP